MNNKIILITTDGCYGCTVMERNINIVIKDHKYNIVFDSVDYKNEKYRHLINRYNVTDFPSTLFLKENEVVYKFTGSKSYEEINKIIVNYLR